MKPKKINIIQLFRLFRQIRKKPEKAIGNYIFKDFRIQISKYKLSNSQRVSQLYHRRRNMGLCIACGKKVTNKNIKTGKLFRLCDFHRKIIDKK